MNKYSLSILSSFVLGIASAIFFIHINIANDIVSYKANSSSLSASIIGASALDSATSTPGTASASTTASAAPLPVFVVNTVSASASTTPKRYEYKLLHDVDPCTMNKLGAQGWNAFQFGGNLESFYGTDENCKNGKVIDVLDWVLFSRDNQ